MLKAALIGCGNIAGGYDVLSKKREIWSHAKAYCCVRGVKLVGVCDVSAQKAETFAQHWNVSFHGTDVDLLMQTVKPDLISICAPTSTHVSLIKKLCDYHPKGILCEKPLSYDVNEAQKVVALCDRNGVTLAVNFQRNWDKALNAVGKKLSQGELGSIELIRVLYSKGLIHNGSHFLSLLLHWFGPLKVEKVFSAKEGAHGDLYADFLLSSSLAPRIVFQEVDASTFVLNEIDILCQTGRLRILNGGLQMRWTDKSYDPLLPQDSILESKSSSWPSTLHRSLSEVVANLIASVHGEASLKCLPKNAIETLKICETIKMLSGKVR